MGLSSVFTSTGDAERVEKRELGQFVHQQLKEADGRNTEAAVKLTTSASPACFQVI